jgi:hypothetical protein
VLEVRPSDLVKLGLEPKNPFDENAVAASTDSGELSGLANIPPTTYQGSHRQYRL